MPAGRLDAPRRLGALAAAALGAVLCLRWPREVRSIPGWPAPDEHQGPLEAWSGRWPEVLAEVPQETVLGYLPRAGTAQPFDPAARDTFERLQATLAPRRIVASPEAELVVAHVGALVLLSKVAGFERLADVRPVAPEWVLVRREPR